MVLSLTECKNVGINTYDGGHGRMETISDRYKRCSFQNLIQHIDIYGKFKSNYVERCKLEGCVSMITSSCYRNLVGVHGSVQGFLEKMSKFSVTTKVSSLYPGQDAVRRRRRVAVR